MAEEEQELYEEEEIKEWEAVDDSSASGFAVTDEEIDAVQQYLKSLDLRVQPQGSSGTEILSPNNNGMDSCRFQFVLLRMMQQKTGNLLASVDEAFAHQWVKFGRTDFEALRRDRQTHDSRLTQETVK